MSGPLAGLRVVDLADPLSAFAGRALADLGADVVLIEPPAGAPLRRHGPYYQDRVDPELSLPFWYYRAAHRSRVLDLDRAADRDRLRALLAGAHVWLEALPPERAAEWGLAPADLERDFPHLIAVSLSPFGRTGPRAEWRGGDYLAWAAGGPMSLIGLADREPLDAPWQATHLAGLWAAIAALAARIARDRIGAGQRIDLALNEAVAAHASGATIFAAYADQRHVRRGGDSGLVCPSVVAPCRDGHIQVVTVVRRQWLTLIQWLAEAGAAAGFDDPAYVDVVRRMQERDRIHAAICRWTAGYRKHDLFRAGQERGLAFGVVQTTADLAVDPQLAERGFFRPLTHPALAEPIRLPGAPHRLADPAAAPPPLDPTATPGDEWMPRRPAAGQANGPLAARRSAGGAPPETPLAGLRVLDFTWVWAGPFGTRILGDLGADVIKVEARQAGDGARWNPPFQGGERGIDRSGLFNDLNHNKRGLTVDLKHPDGRALIERLALEWADVIVENFGAGTLERLGLDPVDLLARQPRLSVIRLAGFGQTGPYRDYLGYAPAIHALAGLTATVRYPDHDPIGVAIPLGDYAGGLFGVLTALAAVIERAATGRGQVVDLSQFEAAVGLVGPALLDGIANGREPAPRPNRHDPVSGQARWLVAGAPGVWHPIGDPAAARPIGRWLAVAPGSAGEWAALAAAIDQPPPDWPPSAETAARIAGALAAWAAERAVESAAAGLQAAGVPAMVVQEAWELIRHDPQLAARGFYQRIRHPACGEVIAARLPPLFATTPPAIRRPAPLLGEHNVEILADILGLSDERIGDLIERNVV